VEKIAEPALAQAEPIPGRGVIIADTHAPRRFERGIGDLGDVSLDTPIR